MSLATMNPRIEEARFMFYLNTARHAKKSLHPKVRPHCVIHQPSAEGATSLEEHSVSQDFITLTAERELHPLVAPKASQFLDQLRLSPAQGCAFPSLLILVTLQKTRPTRLM